MNVVQTSDLIKLLKEKDEDPMKNVSFDMTVEIEEAVYQKIMYWVDKSDFEVSGLGKVVVDKERNVIRVIDAILLKQENGSASTEIDAAAIGKAMFLMKDQPGDLRYWWHSHQNMGVFWSGTDAGTMKQLGGNGWFVATVLNKKHETKTAFVQSIPVRLIVDDVKTSIRHIVDPNLIDKWDKEYEDNITIKTSLFSSWNSNLSSWMNNDNNHENFNVSQAIKAEEDKQEKQEQEEIEDCTEEYQRRLDELFDLFEKGEISEKQYDKRVVRLENEFVDFEDTNLPNDDEGLLSDEEAKAMDLTSGALDKDKE